MNKPEYDIIATSEDFNRWVCPGGQKYKKNDARSKNRVWSGPTGPETC